MKHPERFICRLPSTVRAIASLALALWAWQPMAHSQDPFAKVVVWSHILTGNSGNSQMDPSKALGPSDGGFVSLGGPGAHLIVDMGADTPVLNGPGPDLEVREIGSAFGGVDENYRVLVSNSTDTNQFIFVGEGRALSLIDIASSGLTSARYVWLQDLATETLSSATPGSDIDSLRALHFAGGNSNLPPPTGVSVRPTGQGAWLAWAPSAGTNVTGYAIRRSLDGVSFGSSPDATVSPRENAWHDLAVPGVGPVHYAVSALAGNAESVLAAASLGVVEISILTNSVAHVGDDTVAGWEVPSPIRSLQLNFQLARPPQGPQAELSFELWDVDNSGTPILINGAKVGATPTQSLEEWRGATFRFPAGALQAGENVLIFGGESGGLDDFQIRNIWLRTFDSGTDFPHTLLTSTRFTQIVPGQNTVTLRWVVQQTPTLAPPSWETVSTPIEWTGAITSSNGFFRLESLP